jgi:DNA-binding HxlR family transcriptional regulator
MRSNRSASETEAQERRPIMRLLDLLGRRWTLRVLWELRDGDAFTFRGLQEACGGLSSSVLSARLGELRDAGLVDHGDGGYRVSAAGRELIELLGPLNAWATRRM